MDSKEEFYKAVSFIAGEDGIVKAADLLNISRAPMSIGRLHKFRSWLLNNYSYNSYSKQGINYLTIALEYLRDIKATRLDVEEV